jgi:rhodanese-related sulfurtransferase
MGRLPDDAGTALDDHRLTMQVPTNPQRPRGAGNEENPMTVTLAELIATARAQVREVAPADACAAHDNSELALIVDVREPAEYRESHIPDAVNIPRGLLELRADPASPVADPGLTADRSARVLVYCTKGPGARSLLAAQTLAAMGYERTEALAGGLVAWAEAGLPTEGEPQPATT